MPFKEGLDMSVAPALGVLPAAAVLPRPSASASVRCGTLDIHRLDVEGGGATHA